jgi:hypothetical protein
MMPRKDPQTLPFDELSQDEGLGFGEQQGPPPGGCLVEGRQALRWANEKLVTQVSAVEGEGIIPKALELPRRAPATVYG